MSNITVAAVLSLFTLCTGAVLKRNQCGQLPQICPQWCMGTGSNGCTECNCAKYSPQISGGSNSISGLGAVSAGGLSMINPGNMMAFGSAAQGNAGSGSQFGNQPSAMNPAYMGPQNPFLSGTAGNDPSNPAGSKDPSNYGQNPANPANAFIGNGITGGLNPGNLGGPVTGSGSKPISYPNQQSGQNLGQQPVQVVSTTQSTSAATTSTSAVTTSQTASGPSTCAPLRCVAPCDHGVALAPSGCPVCVCR